MSRPPSPKPRSSVADDFDPSSQLVSMSRPPSPGPRSSVEDDLLISTDFQPRVRRHGVVSSVDSPFSLISLAPPRPSLVHESKQLELAMKSRVGGSATTRDLFAGHQARVTSDPIEFSRQLSLWASGNGWRSYTNYIGGRIMYDGYSVKTIQSIMEAPQVTAKIRQLSEERLEKLHLPPDTDREAKLRSLERQLGEVTFKIADGLVAKMDSVRFLRFFGASTNTLLARLYHQGIHISLAEFAEFRAVAERAAEKKQSLILLPSHKSHIDYLTMSWLFFRVGLSLPHIVAGANLNMPILGSWLQKCGAFFIRRSFGEDSLYPVIVKEYIEGLLSAGMNLECFIEGGRSRTGKLLPPKLGILKYVVEALQNGRAEDVWICPVSLQYDKVIETESYINELLGEPKEKETLAGLLLNANNVIQLQLGRIDVRFQKPFSLKGWLEEQTSKRAKAAPTIKRKEQAVLLRALGYQVLSDINRCSVVMPAGLVGAVLLTIRGRGVGKAELVERVTWLRGAIEARGGKVADFRGMSVEAVVDRALLVLKDLIGEHKGLIEPTYYPAKRFELSFYRNQVIHLFVSESMLCCALYTRVKAGGATPSQRMPRTEVLEELHFLSRLLQHEFVYGTEGLEANAADTIRAAQRDEVILVEGDLIGLSPKERESGRNRFDLFCFLLWPFIETYWLAAVSLFALTPPEPSKSVAWYAEKEFHKSAQLLGKSAHYQGDISYLEAVNQATLANAFQRFTDLGVLITRKSSPLNGKSIPIIALHPKWQPERLPSGEIAPRGRLWDFLAHLGTFRREGKNRRDSATVSSRMFKHCSAIAPPVVEWSEHADAAGPESDFWASRPKL